MKGAFPPYFQPHVLVLSSFPKESVHFMTFPFPLISLLQLFSLILTSRQYALN